MASDKKSNIAFDPVKFAIYSGIGAYNSIMDSMSEYNSYNLQAGYYDAEGKLSQYAFANNTKLLNMENAAETRNISDAFVGLIGTQNAALAASGFDMSVGDKRLMADTARKSDRAIYEANMSAYYKAFEMNRQANMRTIQSKAQAKIARQNAKYAAGWGMFSRILTSTIGSFANSISPINKTDTSAKVGA